jgi:hypothetical protein
MSRLPPTTLAALALLLVVTRPAVAGELDVDFLGPARAISHSSSASRDTAVLAMQVAPHRVLSGGGDFALVSLATPRWQLRLASFAMLELESEGETSSLLPFPQADIRFWRGLWGYSAALALPTLATRTLGAGAALEATLAFRHESEHYTGSNDGDAGTDYSAVPHIGDFFMLDVAARAPLGRLELTLRAQHKLFVPGHSGYRQAPGGDAILRWRRFARVHPFTALFGEYLFGTDGYPDAYLLRQHTGVVIASRAGEIHLYLSADIGHRKGLAVFTEERTIGFGMRFAFY